MGGEPRASGNTYPFRRQAVTSSFMTSPVRGCYACRGRGVVGGAAAIANVLKLQVFSSELVTRDWDAGATGRRGLDASRPTPFVTSGQLSLAAISGFWLSLSIGHGLPPGAARGLEAAVDGDLQGNSSP